jgi:hypothetical protein
VGGKLNPKGESVMDQSREQEGVLRALHEINQAWTSGRFTALEARLHPNVVGVAPGFAQSERGREAFVAGHREFHKRATIHAFSEREHRVDVVDDAAVATYRYELIYESSGIRYRSTGRDLWLFRQQGADWVAVWRTVLEWPGADETIG